MKCPRCGKDDPQGREMCPSCGAPVRPIPIPPGGEVRFGQVDWFVLEKREDRMLLLSREILEQRPYHGRETDVTWADCDLRKYLNGEFYHAFSVADRERILEGINENKKNPWYGTAGGEPTADRVFLLSIEETIQYFGDSGQIVTRLMYPDCSWCKDEFLPWLDDQYNVARRAVDREGVVRFWRLRSPGANNRHVAAVTGFCGDGFDQGGIDLAGCAELMDGHFVHDGCGYLSGPLPNGQSLNGVRPALWVRRA